MNYIVDGENESPFQLILLVWCNSGADTVESMETIDNIYNSTAIYKTLWTQ